MAARTKRADLAQTILMLSPDLTITDGRNLVARDIASDHAATDVLSLIGRYVHAIYSAVFEITYLR